MRFPDGSSVGGQRARRRRRTGRHQAVRPDGSREADRPGLHRRRPRRRRRRHAVGVPCRRTRVRRRGTHRASIISLASVADVGSRGGDVRLDPRRFRMLIELDGVEAYGEDGWRVRRLRLGGAVLRVGQRIQRCVMTNLAPDTGANDFDTLTVLAQHRKVGNGAAPRRLWGRGTARPDRGRRPGGTYRLTSAPRVSGA